MKKTSNIIIAILLLTIFVLGYLYYNSVNDYNEILNILKNKNKTSHIILNDEYILDYDEVIKKDGVFVRYDFIKKYIDRKIELSNSKTRVYIKPSQLDFNLETKELDEFVSNNLNNINIPLRNFEGKKYINLELLDKIYPIKFKYFDNKIIYISSEENSNEEYISNDKKKLYFLEGKLLIKFDQIDKNSKFILLSKKYIGKKEYLKIISNKGQIGYILNENNDKLSKDLDDRNTKLNEIRDNKEFKNISLIWDSISNYNDPKNYKMDSIEGLNVISPTWFSLNINGIVINEASSFYVKNAHKENYDVWALYSNSFNPKWTNQLLSNEENINHSIAQMIFYSSLYDLDGINIDFENIYLSDKDRLTYYVKKLRKYTKMQNIKLSIDAVVPGGSDRYSKVIDRKNISDYVDYFMLMAYDEHWGSSPKSGSIASIPWVVKGIEGTLKNIPKEKLVLGVPLYTRVWEEKNNRVSSKAYSMKNLNLFLKDYDYKINYDTDSGQNYIEIKNGESIFKIWIEDKTSLKKRIDLINQYDLKGIAGWRKGYEKDIYWNLINEELKK